MLPDRSSRAIERIALIILGVLAFLAFIFALLCVFLPGSQVLIPMLFGILAGSIGAMAMVLLRRRGSSSGWHVTAAALLWFMGCAFVGTGIMVTFLQDDNSFATNLGIGLALCDLPGLLLASAGGALYYRDRRRGRLERLRTQPPVQPGATVEPGQARDDVLVQAGEYRRRITDLIRKKRPHVFASRLADIPEERIGLLLQRLADVNADELLGRDKERVPAEIARLKAEMAGEQDAEVREQMQKTLSSYEEQEKQLERLASLGRRTRLQLDETLAAMGTIYSQLQVLDALDADNSQLAHIQEDIRAQASGLGDLLAAVAEVRGADHARPAHDQHPAG